MRGLHPTLSEADLAQAVAWLGPVNGLGFELAAQALRAEQPHLVRCVVAALAALGARPLHLALELLVVQWVALRLRLRRPSRQVSRRNFCRCMADVGAWMDELAPLHPRMLERWAGGPGTLPQGPLLAAVVTGLFEDLRASALPDAARSRIFQVLLSSVVAQRRAGARRSPQA